MALATHYQTLGVPETVGRQTIRAAYRLKVREVHPDLGHNEADRRRRHRLTVTLNEAHRVLSDPGRRGAYDLELQTKRQVGPRPVARSTNAPVARKPRAGFVPPSPVTRHYGPRSGGIWPILRLRPPSARWWFTQDLIGQWFAVLLPGLLLGSLATLLSPSFGGMALFGWLSVTLLVHGFFVGSLASPLGDVLRLFRFLLLLGWRASLALLRG